VFTIWPLFALALLAWPILGWLVVRRLGCLFGAIVSLTLVPMAIWVVTLVLYFGLVLVTGVLRVAAHA
jgi:hypothetical protein